MVGHALDRAVGAAGRRRRTRWCAAGSRTSGRLASSAARRRRPRGARLAVDRAPLRQQPAAGRKSSSHRITRAPAAPGRQRRHQPGRAGADHQHVAMQRGRARNWSGSARRCGAAQPGGAADQRLVHPLPERGRPHEGLVVEAGAAAAATTSAFDRHQVEAQRREAVLAVARASPSIQLGDRGARVGLAPRAARAARPARSAPPARPTGCRAAGDT